MINREAALTTPLGSKTTTRSYGIIEYPLDVCDAGGGLAVV
jgi:hypothetical protein